MPLIIIFVLFKQWKDCFLLVPFKRYFVIESVVKGRVGRGRGAGEGEKGGGGEGSGWAGQKQFRFDMLFVTFGEYSI